MNNELSIGQLFGLIVPLALVELGLMLFALRDLIRRKRVTGDNKWLWGAIIVLFGILGPIVYFVTGREEE